MTAIVLDLAARQTCDVQRRAVEAVTRQRERLLSVRTLAEPIAAGVQGCPSLEDWHAVQVERHAGKRLVLAMTRDEKALYGLRPSTKLTSLLGLGPRLDYPCVTIVTLGLASSYAVGVQASNAGGGVGVIIRKSYKALDYADALAATHGLPVCPDWRAWA